MGRAVVPYRRRRVATCPCSAECVAIPRRSIQTVKVMVLQKGCGYRKYMGGNVAGFVNTNYDMCCGRRPQNNRK